MKNSKKLIALVLAMMMIFALTASALAATDSTNDVTVTISFTKRGSYGMTGFGSHTVTLTKEKPTDVLTVYDVVEAVAADETVKDVRNTAWIDVPIQDANGNLTDETGKALVYIALERESYNSQYVLTTVTENLGSHGSTVATPRADGKFDCTYTGSDWIYYINSDTVAETNYMDKTAISNGDVIKLFFQDSSLSWVADEDPNVK